MSAVSSSVSPFTKPTKADSSSPYNAPVSVGSDYLQRDSITSEISLLPSAISTCSKHFDARHASIISAGSSSSSPWPSSASASLPHSRYADGGFSVWTSPVRSTRERSSTNTSRTTSSTARSSKTFPPSPAAKALVSTLSASAKRGNSHLPTGDRASQRQCTARLMRKLHETIGLLGDADIDMEIERHLGDAEEEKTLDQREGCLAYDYRERVDRWNLDGQVKPW